MHRPPITVCLLCGLFAAFALSVLGGCDEPKSETAALVDLGSSRNEQDASRLSSEQQHALIAKAIAAHLAASETL